MMRNLKISLLLIALILISINSYSQTWTSKANLPEAREGAICFSINDKVYWGGGTPTTKSGITNTFYEYDPTTDKWTQKANLPEPRGYAASFAIGNKGYITVGITPGSGASSILASTYEYDPATDNWTKKADINANNYGYSRMSSFVVNGKGYVIGGYNASLNPRGKMFEYDPNADTWTEKANYPLTIQGADYVVEPFAFSIGNKGYVSSGEVRKSSGLGTEFTTKTFEYDPSNDTWTPKADFIGDGRAKGTAFVINNKAYCGLGYQKDANFLNVFFKDMYSYDAAADKWTKVTDFAGGERVDAAVVVTTNNVFLGGGGKIQSGQMNDWYAYNYGTSVNSEISRNTTINFYPNPAKGIIYLKATDQFESYTIYSIDGRQIASGSMDNGQVIDVRHIPTGQYMIEVKNNMQLNRGLVTISK